MLRRIGAGLALAGVMLASHSASAGDSEDVLAVMDRAYAAIWGDYDFWIDDEFSHCGGTSVTLAKVDGNWMIANWMWTVEKKNCPTAPASD